MNKDKKNIFNEKTIEGFSLAELFEKERLKNNISIKFLSEVTGISSRNLKKIESGNWKSLPADIYVRSFLEKSAKVFGVESDIFLDLYEKEAGIKNTNQKVEKISKRSFIITPVIIIKLFFAISSVVMVIYFLGQLNYLLGDPKLVVLNPENDIITSDSEILIEGETQHDNKVIINENEVFVDSEGYFSEIIPLQPGINSINIRSINRLNNESSVVRRIILEE